jgi:hypothetical protein
VIFKIRNPLTVPVLGLFFASTTLLATNIGSVGYISPAKGQSLTASQSAAFNAYQNALNQFKSLLHERRAQIESNRLPKTPGRALHQARNDMFSTYKDVTDIIPAKIGRSNKFRLPSAYFDADNEPLIDEYESLFAIMEAPPSDAQSSNTPFKDVFDLGTAIARVKGLDASDAQVAGRISLGIFFAETAGVQNRRNARSDLYQGSLQTGVSEDQNGQKKWAAVKNKIAAFDPDLIARDDKEEARVDNLDHRFNHWTGVRDGLMNAPADSFPQIPAIVKTLPDPMDQMKLFELIQIVPSPTRSALNSGNLTGYKISDAKIMGYLRNNSIFAFGHLDRARTSATFREIIDAMWPFDYNLGRAVSQFNEIKAH